MTFQSLDISINNLTYVLRIYKCSTPFSAIEMECDKKHFLNRGIHLLSEKLQLTIKNIVNKI